MPKALTKQKWAKVKEALLHVPIRSRDIAWKNAMDLVDHILTTARNNLAPDIDIKRGSFAVDCDLCREPIALEDDYVFHSISGKYVHYDCHHKSSGPIGSSAA